MAITPEKIRNLVVDEDDFAHEMAVASILSDFVAYEVKHGGTYTDPITGKPRQFDFRANLLKERSELSLSIECKNLSSKSPLVVCGRPRTENEAFHDLVWSRNGRYKRVDRIAIGASSETMRARLSASIYNQGNFTGKSLLRLKDSAKGLSKISDSDVYDKWSQALSSLNDAIVGSSQRAQELKLAEVYLAFLPVIVVPNDVLWQCTYDMSGNLNTEPIHVEECSFFVGREQLIGIDTWKHRFCVTHIHFMTLSGLRSYLSRMINDNDWNKLFTSKAIQLL